ncbi:hypothetical protein ALP99_102416 [Pseudomonas syringae pv. tomato]|uniref:Uncharacterized protein n=1 Tax=Pseudomonas syringae pv. maculicola TaxID=59511 RepID=A0A0N0X132_PSEYM|nr:Unknown protein sequence [Pseudomonas syringae pv. maculicola str. M6]KPC05748.1 Unknown protein sequence [Pseudomonas amygdali pv. lachrymans]KPC16272.1 Unknown protein sequence [Pseudomonas syringae pv. maculicola]RMM16387.1 hypothetical protein ALQ85_102365 [Pseudomonas syringae]RMP38966.1 hypothetical protein ALQ23_102321 [Pseudomonas syringae pv. antirrhini]RMQ77640.1 hypothetical protein ALP99_102416 [Pseudomonas syringae pv. tomato]
MVFAPTDKRDAIGHWPYCWALGGNLSVKCRLFRYLNHF